MDTRGREGNHRRKQWRGGSYITIHKHKYVSPQPCGLSLTKNTHPSEKNKTFGDNLQMALMQ